MTPVTGTLIAPPSLGPPASSLGPPASSLGPPASSLGPPASSLGSFATPPSKGLMDGQATNGQHSSQLPHPNQPFHVHDVDVSSSSSSSLISSLKAHDIVAPSDSYDTSKKSYNNTASY